VELRTCWNFVNIRVEFIDANKERGARPDLLVARNYFKDLLDKTQYPICRELLNKIDRIEQAETVSTLAQETFMLEHTKYLSLLEEFSSFEFEMLNSGRSIEDVRKESEFLKKL